MSYIVKTLSSKSVKNGFSQVFFAIRIGSDKRIRTQSGIFVPAKHWNEKKKELSVPRSLGPELIRELITLKEKLDNAEKRTLKLVDILGDDVTKGMIEEMMELLKDIPGTITEDIVNDFLKKQEQEEQRRIEEEKRRVTVFDFCDKYINKGYSDPKIRNLKVTFRTMSRYVVYRNNIVNNPFRWSLEETTKEDIEDFFDYLANEHIYRKNYAEVFAKAAILFPEENKRKHKTIHLEERGQNTLVTLKKSVKSFWNWLIKTQQTNNNPFIGVEIGTEVYGTPY